MEDESEGSGQPGDDASLDDVASPTPAPAPRNPRQVRARRRRRRRQLGTLLFVLVAGAVLATAYFAVAGGDDDSSQEEASASTVVSTTVAPPFLATYKTTAGINVRQAPGTSAPTVAVVEQGRDVTVVCVVQGEVVNTPRGPDAKWLKVAGGFPVGYVSAAFVTAGADLGAGKIPTCPAT